MRFVFTELAWEDYLFWQKNEKQKLKSINELLKDISRNPYKGIEKPEPLKFDLQGYWSRRIDDEHRIVYAFDAKKVTITQCRFHYQK